MPSAADVTHRYLQLLRLIPVAPRRTDAARLERQLRDEGIELHRRSIQRNLEELGRSRPGLRCDRSSKPYAWYWDKDYPLGDLPHMDTHTAITLELAHAHLVHVLPRAPRSPCSLRTSRRRAR
jgi:hypothetical protein